MPLTSKGEKILSNMQSEYGQEKGESVLYASKQAGTITGIETPMVQLGGGQSGGLVAIPIPEPRAHSGVHDCVDWLTP